MPKKTGEPKESASKTSMLMRMMARREGATSREMQEAAAWAAHAVRGVVGALKRRGLQVVVLKRKRQEAVYHLLDLPCDNPT